MHQVGGYTKSAHYIRDWLNGFVTSLSVLLLLCLSNFQQQWQRSSLLPPNICNDLAICYGNDPTLNTKNLSCVQAGFDTNKHLKQHPVKIGLVACLLELFSNCKHTKSYRILTLIIKYHTFD